MYDTHKPKIPKCNKFIKFFYVTIINSCINRLPEGKGSIAFKQIVIMITSVQSSVAHYVL